MEILISAIFIFIVILVWWFFVGRVMEQERKESERKDKEIKEKYQREIEDIRRAKYLKEVLERPIERNVVRGGSSGEY